MGISEDRNAAGQGKVRQFFTNKINLLCIPVLIYCVYFIAELLVHTLADADIPNEYREAANVLLTRVFMSGENPYSLSSLSGELPGFIYLYGPLYSCVTALIAGVLPVNIVLIHYIVTFISMLVSGIFAAKIVRRYSHSLTAPVCAFLFLLVCHWRYGFVNAVPDSMALMFMMITLYVLLLDDFKYKAMVCAVLTLASFFTKQYFLLVAGTVFIYLFIYERRMAFKYVLDCAILAAALALVITLTCPLFWTYTIYLAKGPGSGVAGHVTKNGVKVTSGDYNLQQIMSVGGLFLFFFLAETAGVIASAVKRKYTRADVLMFIHLAVSGICLVGYLGKNGGAWLSYYLELFIPALVVGALIMLEKLSGLYLDAKARFRKKYILTAVLLSYVLMAGFTIMRVEQRLPKTPMDDGDYAAWSRARAYTEEYSDGEEYLYPLLAYYGIEEGQYIYNSGQPFVVSEKFYNKYMESQPAQKYFPYAKDIFEQHLNYRKEILSGVLNGEYSLVTYIPDYEADEVFTAGDLQQKYRLADTLTLRTGRQLWDVEFWVLK